MGNTVMGSDEIKFITDQLGRVCATDNLYVVAPNLFPSCSSGAVSLLLTLSVMGERLANHWFGMGLSALFSLLTRG